MTDLRRHLLALALPFLMPVAAVAQEPGQWAHRAELLAPNSEFAVAELDGRLHILVGYPADRVTVTTAQIYDIAGDRWERGWTCPCRTITGWLSASTARSI